MLWLLLGAVLLLFYLRGTKARIIIAYLNRNTVELDSRCYGKLMDLGHERREKKRPFNAPGLPSNEKSVLHMTRSNLHD